MTLQDMKKSGRMPKPSTLRKYYPDSLLTGEQLADIAEWLRKYSGHQHISPDNHILAVLVAWEESQGKDIRITQEEYSRVLLWYELILGEAVESHEDTILFKKLVRLYGGRKL